jgi:hypothetical protein
VDPRALGAAVLVGVATIVLGWDSSVLTRLSERDQPPEQSLISRFQPQTATTGATRPWSSVLHGQRDRDDDGRALPEELPVEGELPRGRCDPG